MWWGDQVPVANQILVALVVSHWVALFLLSGNQILLLVIVDVVLIVP